MLKEDLTPKEGLSVGVILAITVGSIAIISLLGYTMYLAYKVY